VPGLEAGLGDPPEFRQRAIDLARSKVKPVGEIAKDLSISESCLRNWMSQVDADEGTSNSTRLSSDEKRELAELREKTRRLEVGNEISSVRPRTSPGRTFSQSSLPAGP